jgi:hypothetical protein
MRRYCILALTKPLLTGYQATFTKISTPQSAFYGLFSVMEPPFRPLCDPYNQVSTLFFLLHVGIWAILASSDTEGALAGMAHTW